jgi:23S rRNA (adenine-N6)-dimethyltransferase
VEGDAVGMTLPSEPFRVVANLPFHRTADLLRLLLDDPRAPLLRADLVVEWDVAVKRALPWPSSVTGVVRSAYYEASVARRLTSGAFVPAPAVDAGVLVLRRRRVPLVPVVAADDYRRFVAAGFRRGVVDVAAARAVRRVAPGRRAARDLDAHEWAALFAAVGAAPAAQRSRSFDRSRSSSR